MLNSEGKPVERTLSEMTGGEVIAALDWIGEQSDSCGGKPRRSEALPNASKRDRSGRRI
jgi:hypothetical protein